MPEVRTEQREADSIVAIDRPEKRNAISPEVMEKRASAVEAFDGSSRIRCIVIAGSNAVFAADADIKAMAERSFQQALEASTAAYWQRIGACRTPLVAAVSGLAL